jgi:oxygen-independent coproporphyrinogen-3 oxidase
MLQIRLREGLAKDELTETQLRILENYPEQIMSVDNRLILTPQGRLIADRIVRELI